MASDHASGGVDYLQCWPCVHGIAAPHAKLAIVDNRVRHAKPVYSIADALGSTFRVVFAAVHTDDRNLIRETLLELPQLRENMNAVYSTIRPEIEEQDLASKVSQNERAVARVYPVEALGKFGCPY